MIDEETTGQTAVAIVEHEERLARLREDEAIVGSQLKSARETVKELVREPADVSWFAPDRARVAKLERDLRLIRAAIAEEERRRPELEARHEAAMNRARESSEYLGREAAKGRTAVAAGQATSDAQHRLASRRMEEQA